MRPEVKGTCTVYLSSSFYIINYKPVIHGTDFHCIHGLHVLLCESGQSFVFYFHVYQPDSEIIQYKYLNRVHFDCKAKLCLGQAGKIYFYTGSFCLKDIHNDTNKQDTSCKYKHMMKSRAPSDKVGVLHHLLPIEFHGFITELISRGYQCFVPGLI